MKKIAKFLIFSLLFCNFLIIQKSFCSPSFHEQASKYFALDTQTLYYSAINAILLNNYKIDEIQSDSASALFEANEKKYLMQVSNNYVKILPVNSDFSSGFAVQDKIFKTIEGKIQK